MCEFLFSMLHSNDAVMHSKFSSDVLIQCLFCMETFISLKLFLIIYLVNIVQHIMYFKFISVFIL